MEIRKISINNKLYDVVSMEEYCKNNSTYDAAHTAVLDSISSSVLPIRSKLDSESVGIRYGGVVSVIKEPETEEDKKNYSVDNMIDFSNPTSFKEFIENSQRLKDMERDILLTVDNKTKPIIDEEDTAAMVGLKTAVANKECDINSYDHRFGPNFANDKRILNEHDVSLKKIIKFGESMDFDVDLIFRDKNPDVPNPIGKEIKVTVTGNGGN